MKNFETQKSAYLRQPGRKHQWSKRLFFLLTLGFAVSSCKKDDEAVPAAPTVSFEPATASGTPGSKVTTTITINAPGGAKTLRILKNGAPDATRPDVTLAGQTTVTQPFEYTIEQLANNAVVNFSFQAVDNRNQVSPLATFVVTATATPAKTIVEVPAGNITVSTTWTKDKIYRLNGFVRVGTDAITGGTAPVVSATAVLTIQPGTLIIGDRETKGTLIVQRGSQLIAKGTAAEPIVFTSEKAVGQREPGDWGGVVICGRAANNLVGGTFGNGIGELEGQYGAYHGGGTSPNNADKSGELDYVRIEFAGIPINPNQEVNSLTMGSVGSGTQINHVMCSYGLDDAFEWFGGSANAKYLIAYRGLDDDFDVDNGFSGNVQFGLGIRAANGADQSGSNGFEVDNDGGGTAASPFTSGTFANVTIIGPKKEAATAISVQFQNAMHLRRNNKIKIYNSFFTGYPNGLFIDGANTAANANSGELILRGIVIAGVEGWGTNGFGDGASVNPRGFAVRDVNTATPPVAITIGSQKPTDWFAAQPGNRILTKWQDAGISASLFDPGTPSFAVDAAASGTIATGAVAVPTTPGIEIVTYRGAFGATDWTATWAEWNPTTKTYQ